MTWALLWYCPTVLLGFLSGQAASVGWFGGAHRIVMSLHTFVWLYFFNLLPSLSRTAARSRPELSQMLSGSLDLTAWGSVFVAVAATVSAGPVLELVYGSGFQDGGRVLGVLIWLIPLAMVSGHYRYALLAHDMQRFELRATLVAALTSILLSLILIPWFGSIGAAVALVAAGAVNLAAAYWLVHAKIVAIPAAPHVIAPLGAAGVGLSVFSLISAQPAAAAAAGIAIYAVVFLIMRGGQLRSLFRFSA
jgi:O-antigen/teichoic acid export membrane protein